MTDRRIVTILGTSSGSSHSYSCCSDAWGCSLPLYQVLGLEGKTMESVKSDRALRFWKATEVLSSSHHVLFDRMPSFPSYFLVQGKKRRAVSEQPREMSMSDFRLFWSPNSLTILRNVSLREISFSKHPSYHFLEIIISHAPVQRCKISLGALLPHAADIRMKHGRSYPWSTSKEQAGPLNKF